MPNIGFLQNWTNLFFIDTTPEAAPTWARMASGINDVTPSGNEVIAQDNYYDGEGVSDSEVTGGQPIVNFAGHRKVGDPAQDYIASKYVSYGNARRTHYLQIMPDGTRMEANATLANIVPHGGDPNAKGNFSYEVHMNGRPSYTPGNKTDFPEQITVSPISVAEGATTAVSVTVTPTSASDSVVYAIDDDEIATVDALGNITGVAAGKCNLNIKSAVLPTVQTTVEVTVTDAELE